MKFFLIAFIAFLMFSATVSAQQFGIRLGGLQDDKGTILPAFGFQIIFNDFFADYVDFRIVAGADFGFHVFEIQATVMFRFPLDQDGKLFDYFGISGGAYFQTNSSLLFGIVLRLGIEYQLTPAISVFADLSGGSAFDSKPGTHVYTECGICLNLK